MKEKIVIRQLSLDDLEEVFALENEIFKDPWDRVGISYALEFKYSYGIGLFMSHDGKEKMIGLMFYSEIIKEANLDSIGIKFDYRGLGLSKILMTYLINKGRVNRWTKIMLEVEDDNIKAISLYKKFGFEYLTKRNNYYGLNRHADIMVRYDL